MPARQALALGRVMVVPSRVESLPYIVLEAAASGKPLIATKVGGIPEIYGPLSGNLVPAEDAPALAEAIGRSLDEPAAAAAARGGLARARRRVVFASTPWSTACLPPMAKASPRLQEPHAVKTLFQHSDKPLLRVFIYKLARRKGQQGAARAYRGRQQLASVMSDINTRPVIGASGAAVVLDRLQGGMRMLAASPPLSPEALAVASRRHRRRSRRSCSPASCAWPSSR